MRKNSLFKYIFVFVILMIIFNINVSAKNICDDSSYQCIMCKYEATGVNVNQFAIFYAKADGNGGVELSSEGTMPGTISWSFGIPSSSFINSSKTGLSCSENIYIKDDHCGNKMCYSVSTSGDNKSRLIDSSDNGKMFINSNSSQQTTYCNSIPIYHLGAGVKDGSVVDGVIKENYIKTSETATVVKKGDGTYDLELPASHSKASSNWNFVSNDLINNCSSDLLVSCYSSEQTSYQSSKIVYYCSLQTTGKLDGRTEVDETGKAVTTTTDTISSKEIKTNLNYGSICGNEGVQTAFKVLGTVIFIVKILAPLLIIVFGMIDYFNAVTSSDENALSKATESLIKRLVSGIVIFFIPTLLWGILNLLDITDGIHDLNNTEFGACTRCLLKNECK